MAYTLPIGMANSKYMNINPINLCPNCAHVAYCITTHKKNAVVSCSEFDELQYKAPTPILKIKKRKPELETV
jgi:hypothetical protein